MNKVPQFLKDRPTLMREIYDWHCEEGRRGTRQSMYGLPICLELYRRCIICTTSKGFSIWMKFVNEVGRFPLTNPCWSNIASCHINPKKFIDDRMAT